MGRKSLKSHRRAQSTYLESVSKQTFRVSIHSWTFAFLHLCFEYFICHKCRSISEMLAIINFCFISFWLFSLSSYDLIHLLFRYIHGGFIFDVWSSTSSIYVRIRSFSEMRVRFQTANTWSRTNSIWFQTVSWILNLGFGFQI